MDSKSASRSLPGKSSQKKCPQCGEWTVWSLSVDDVCTHCGHPLSTHMREKEQRAERILAAPTGLFPINDSDGLFLRYGKRSLNVAHVVFTATIGAIIWFISVVVA